MARSGISRQQAVSGSGSESGPVLKFFRHAADHRQQLFHKHVRAWEFLRHIPRAQTEDNRIVTFSLERRTKYYGSSGGSARVNDFQPGDHIEVDATQDNGNYYHAVKVSLLRAGTPDERTEASKPIDGSSSGSNSASKSSTGSSSSDDDSDRPRLRRASSSSGDESTAPPQSSSSSSNSSSGDDSDRPRIRRAAVSGGDGTPGAEITPGDSSGGAVARPSSSDDSGPPVLARGRPRSAAPSSSPSSSTSDSDSVIAGSRPSIRAEEVNGVTRIPTGPTADDSRAGVGGLRMPQSGDPVIDMARDEAFSFSETLPNYVVKQFTTRFQTEPTRSRSTSWRALDTVTADVVYQDGKESYKNILVNGRTPREAPEKSGSWSSGEFASTLQDIMSPYTNADFHGKRSTTIVNRPAYRYDFSVEQTNSHWRVETSGQAYQPEYTGTVWIDKENYRVLRIELSARNMPRSPGPRR